jgi:hypothetical protein
VKKRKPSGNSTDATKVWFSPRCRDCEQKERNEKGTRAASIAPAAAPNFGGSESSPQNWGKESSAENSAIECIQMWRQPSLMLDRHRPPPRSRPPPGRAENCGATPGFSPRRRERDRRYRARVKAGEAVAMVAYDADDLDKLIRLQVLRECEAGDKAAVAAAIKQVLRNVRL